MAAFQTGDIVQLKSGGPRMTVQKDVAAGNFRCQWFAGSKLEEGTFPEKSLISAQDDDKKAPKKP